MTLRIVDADGPITEAWEQVAKSLADFHRHRPLNFLCDNGPPSSLDEIRDRGDLTDVQKRKGPGRQRPAPARHVTGDA